MTAADREHSAGAGWRAGTPAWQRVLLWSGFGLLLLAVLVPIAVPEWAGPASLAATVGVLGGLIGVVVAVRGRRGQPSSRRPPAVESRLDVSRAGGDFDLALERAQREVTGRAIRARSTVRERLRSLAIAILARSDGESESTAATRIDAGDWPDEDAGGVFETGEAIAPGWLADLLDRSPALAVHVERIVAALEDRLDSAAADRHAASGSAHPSAGEWVPGPYRTRRWAGLVGLALLALMVGALTRTAGPTLVAAVLVGLAGYVRLFDPPAADLEIERQLDPADPRPGEAVSVTVTVANASDRPLVDCRVIDGVPERLTVLDGSPRHATALAAGESTTFTYRVPAAAGEHDFSTAYVELREPAGERARADTLETDVTTLACRPRPRDESVPLHPQATGVTGNVPTDQGGSGLEFHSIRRYRRGDPLHRVDWNRLARTGELATTRLREEHAATVVLLVDVRPAAAVAPGTGQPSAVDRARRGAARLADSLLSDGDRVGLATISRDPTWLPPGGGTTHRERLAAGLQAGEPPSTDWVDFSASQYVRHLRRRLPASSQLLCLSPLLDDAILSVLQHLHAHGHEVSLVSPDPTTRATVGARVVRLERMVRLATLRDAGIRVIDWAADDDLAVGLERARRGWRA